MDIQGMIQGAVQDKLVEQIAAKTGLQWDAAKKAISAAMPMIMGWISKNASTDEGKQALDSALDAHTDAENVDEATGWKILGKIFWAEEGAQVESTVTAAAGVTEEQSKTITQMLASSAMGKLWAEKAAGTDVAGEMKKDNMAQSLLTSFLDKDGDGDIKDDLLSMGVNALKNKFFR